MSRMTEMSNAMQDFCNENYGPDDIPTYDDDDQTCQWFPMETAPKDDQILVRRHNDVMYEYHVVWWTGDEPYPWRSEHTAYPTDRLDEWCRIPGART